MSENKPVIELELYLIRHGQSVSNAAGEDAFNMPVDEREDPILTPKGKEQAILLGERLKNMEFDAIYSSCLKRAVMTANEISAHSLNPVPIFMNPVFSEARTPSSFRGSPIEEIEEISPYVQLAEDADISGGLIMGNENDTDYELQIRAAKAVDYLKSKYSEGQKVAVVFHAAILTHIIFYLLGYKNGVPENVDTSIQNTGITKVVFFKHGTNKFGDVVFEYINDYSHLNK